jgi:hypothetical protein
MTPAQQIALGRSVERFIELGLHDDVLLLAIGLELEIQEHPQDANWKRAAARVHRTATGHPVRYWLSHVLRRDLPRHVPAHESGGITLHCVAPMIRRATCGREVPLRPWSTSTGHAVPVLVGEYVTWHAYCRKHAYHPQTHVRVHGTPEAHAAAKRLRHNTGGQLRDAFPRHKVEDGYRWADQRWEPDDRPVEAVRLRLVPPLEAAEEST